MLEKSKTPGLTRALDILNFISTHGACSVLQIQDALNIPKSSIYNILEELCRQNYLIKSNDGSYSLWLKVVELSNQVLVQMDLRAIAKPYLTDLMLATGLMCHLGVLDQKAAYYVLKIESNSSIRVHSYEGKRLALERSGIGKCLLAFQPEDLIQQTIQNLNFIAKTENSIMSIEAYIQELDLIRKKGWSFDNSEDVEGVRCIAAPIFNSHNTLEAAISIVGASIQINENNQEELVRLTTECARKISLKIGAKINQN
ncbi:MAG: IclR family transcriptional regulator [Acinetobacter sp.]|uniref:IclR family transcriptional regulator n=1 Tax=Acinetobacter TaxID=469 RepID=UPI00148F3569|nr:MULTISPECIES: IclR family transcriptional regulator [Acinetobacter]MDR3029329.1 IclR family transcriptional regulator [Acinetobacter sp.]